LEEEHHLVTAFSFFDKDGNGLITRDELELAFESYNMEPSLLEEIIEAVDHNKVSYFCIKNACTIANFWHRCSKPLSLRGINGLKDIH
jgi:Ca2+-binding EF-hand superfamily protein